MLMNPTQLGQNEYYQGTSPVTHTSKIKFIALIGGAILLIVLVLILLLSGGSKAGQEDMQRSLQATYDSVGILDEYTDKLTLSDTRNDAALMQIILRGNFQKLNELYNKTYKPRKKFGSSPKPDTKSKETLDTAARNNTLDSEILKVLQPKITESHKYLKRSAPSFTKKDSKESIKKSLEDFESIDTILKKAR